jgi:hypothetical protein
MPIYCGGAYAYAYWDQSIRSHRCGACGRRVRVVW